MNRMFVTDQIWYFAELEGSQSLWDGLQHYDYVSSRLFMKGDEALFRPLLFTWLAVQNSLFGVHHVLWNITQLLLHFGVVFVLYRLLLTIRPSKEAALFALLFSLMMSGVELVLWNHLGGYLWAFGLAMVGLMGARKLGGPNILTRTLKGPLRTPPVAEPSGSAKLDDGSTERLRAWLLFLGGFGGACLFYEVMAPIAALWAGYVLYENRRSGGRPKPSQMALLFTPVMVFSLLYLSHRVGQDRVFFVDGKGPEGIFSSTNLIHIPGRVGAALVQWLGEAFLPTGVEFTIRAYHRFSKSLEWFSDRPAHLAALVLAVATVWILLRAGKRWSSEGPFCLTLLLSVMIYATIISFGRTEGDILGIGYYPYFFNLALVIALYALLDFENFDWGPRLASLLVFEVYILMNGFLAFKVCREAAEANRLNHRYFTSVGRFVDSHRHEWGFSFGILHPQVFDPDPTILMEEGYPTDPGVAMRAMRLSHILFRKYYNDENPRYWLEINPDLTIRPLPAATGGSRGR